MKKDTNDQTDIIEALSIGDYAYVWHRVFKCGYKIFEDINERYAVFCDCVDNFDCSVNNNFIKYYMEHLKYVASYNNRTFYVSTNRSIIRKLRNENISPTDCEKSRLTQELKNWSN